MALKAVLESLDDVDEGLRSHYTKDEETGKFRLEAEGLVPKVKVDQFRQNNLELTNQLKDLQAKVKQFDGIDPEEYARLKADLDKLNRKAGKGDDGDLQQRIEAELAKATNKLTAKHKEELSAKEAEAKTFKARYERKVIDSEITKAAVAAGVQETAIDDVLYRSRDVFALDDKENVVALDSNGQPMLRDADAEPMTVKDWLNSLAMRAPHLFKGSSGGGASNGGGGGQMFSGRAIRKKSDLRNDGEKAAYIAHLREKHGPGKATEAWLSLPD